MEILIDIIEEFLLLFLCGLIGYLSNFVWPFNKLRRKKR